MAVLKTVAALLLHAASYLVVFGLPVAVVVTGNYWLLLLTVPTFLSLLYLEVNGKGTHRDWPQAPYV